MQTDAGFFAVAALAVVFAGVSKGGFGSGAAFASAAILALIVPPGQALGIMLPLLMLIDAVNLKPYWRKWDWPASKVLILGGIPGVAIGAAFYSVANDDLIRFLIGSMAVGFVAWQLAQKFKIVESAKAELPFWAGIVAGAVAGFTSLISHAGGPPAAVYLLSKRLDKTRFQASTVLVFWVINLFKAIPYGVLGIFTLETLMLDLLLAPAALFGAWLGVKAHHMVSERVFFGLTYALLLATGGKLIWDAIT